MIIDAHTHVWPDAVAHRALSGNGTGFSHVGDGTLAGLRASMAASGIDRSVVLGVANDAAAVPKVARFSSSIKAPDVVPLGSVHPDLDPAENARILRDHGLVGVKVHPLYQGLRLDDPGLRASLAALDDGALVVVHVGTGGDGAEVPGCTPALLVALARELPHLNIVGCHFGGYHRLEEALKVVCGSGVLVDTSWPPTLGALDPATVRSFIGRHGVDRVVFASDWPTADPAREVEAIAALGLGEGDTARILGENLADILAPLEARAAQHVG